MENSPKRNFFKYSTIIEYWVIFSIFCVFSYIYFFSFKPWLIEFSSLDPPTIETFFGTADPWVYWYHGTFTYLSNLPLSLKGPVLLVKIMSLNPYLIVAFYLSLFAIGMHSLSLSNKVKISTFLALFLLNPLIPIQFFYVNKEIVLLISNIFILSYVFSRKIIYFILAFFVSLLGKPEYAALLVLFFTLTKLDIKYKYLALVGIISLISIFYFDIPGIKDRTNVLLNSYIDKEVGLSYYLLVLAKDYHAYFLIMLPKVLMNLFEGLVGILLHHKLNVNNILSSISSLQITSFLFLASKRSQLSLSNDIFLIVLLNLLMVSIVPFVHHRYLFPIYPFIVGLALSKHQDFSK